MLESKQEELKIANVSERASNTLYYSVAIVLFTLETIAAICLNDVTVIFGFIAAITESTINFILPAMLYLISLRITRKKARLYSNSSV